MESKSDHESYRSSEEEGAPFIGKSPALKKSKLSWIRGHWRSIAVHATVLIANVIIYVAAISRVSDPAHHTTPLQNSIAYEERKFDHHSVFTNDGAINHNKPDSFSGPPRPALEAAWNRLKSNESVRVSKAELGQFASDDTIIELTDGSGYYSTVSVYHGLHCINRIHHFLYPDHYYPDFDKDQMFLLKRHTEHCLDWLRQYVMCNADTTLIPVHWSAKSPRPVALDWGNHQCVNWDNIEEWMADHAFDPFEPGLLMHPVFGSPYQDDNPELRKLGATGFGKGGPELLHSHDD
ncbi:hypothetical protein SUNI508_07702 [Seiridium unicorne]|uniref:Tat pathway signal sequence n=1 Tax=Seiridium unicorne TaxID=138068 RepID=A0ABR2UW81_9PEZI